MEKNSNIGEALQKRAYSESFMTALYTVHCFCAIQYRRSIQYNNVQYIKKASLQKKFDFI
jgi:hypothetical protein